MKTLTYNNASELVSVLYATAGRITYGYDAAGRRTTMQDWGGVTTWTYNAARQLVSVVYPGGYRLTMLYDAAGNRTTLVDPDGGIFTYTYDTLNRQESVRNPDGDRYTFQYDAASRPTTLLLGLGSKRKMAYDAADRLTTQIELNASNNPIITIIDSYDGVGNRIGRNQDGAATAWTYDAANRLVSQLLSGARGTYVYDEVGNVNVKFEQGFDPLTMTYDAADRLATSQQGALRTTFAYDANGNLTEENANGSRTTNSYDQENRLVGVAYAAGTFSTYTYQGGSPVRREGLRRSAIEPGGSLTTTIWDPLSITGGEYLMEKTP